MLKQINEYPLDHGALYYGLPIMFNINQLDRAHYFKTHKRFSPDYVTELEEEKTWTIFFWRPTHPLSVKFLKKLGILQYFTSPDFEGEFDKVALVYTKKDKLLKEILAYKDDILQLGILNIYSDNHVICQEEQMFINGTPKAIAVRLPAPNLPNFASGLLKKVPAGQIIVRRTTFDYPHNDDPTRPATTKEQYLGGRYYACIDYAKDECIYGDAVKSCADHKENLGYLLIKDRNPFGEVEIKYDEINRKIIDIKVIRNASDRSDEEICSFYKTIELCGSEYQILFTVEDAKTGKSGIIVKDVNGYDVHYDFYRNYNSYNSLQYPFELR